MKANGATRATKKRWRRRCSRARHTKNELRRIFRHPGAGFVIWDGTGDMLVMIWPPRGCWKL